MEAAAKRRRGRPRRYTSEALVALFASRQMERRWDGLPVARRTLERAAHAAGWPVPGARVDQGAKGAALRPMVWVDPHRIGASAERFTAELATVGERDRLFGLLSDWVGLAEVRALEPRQLEGVLYWLDRGDRDRLKDTLAEWAVTYEFAVIERETRGPWVATLAALAAELLRRGSSPPARAPYAREARARR